MTDPAKQEMQVERYLANRMSGEEEARFEEQLLVSVELQNEVELALAIKQALKHDTAAPEPSVAAAPPATKWQAFALAASVSLVILISFLYVNQLQENHDLNARLEAAGQPNANVTIIPVRVFRSGATKSTNRTADLVARKPPSGGMMILDVELDALARQQAQLSATLVDENLTTLASWSIAPGNDSTQIALPVERIPDGLVRFDLTDQDDTVIRSQWIEFLPEQ